MTRKDGVQAASWIARLALFLGLAATIGGCSSFGNTGFWSDNVVVNAFKFGTGPPGGQEEPEIVYTDENESEAATDEFDDDF